MGVTVKVAFVTHEVTMPGRPGGVGRYVSALARSLMGHGHTVQVALPAADERRGEVSGISVQTIPLARGGVDAIVDGEPQLQAVRRWLVRYRPDVVHIHHLFGLSLQIPRVCEELAIPYVLHMHDSGLFCHHAHFYADDAGCTPESTPEHCAVGFAQRFGCTPETAVEAVLRWRSHGQWAVEHAAKVVYVSESLRSDFTETIGWKNANTRVMHPVLDWPQPVERSQHGGDGLQIGVFGLQSKVKGLDLLLNAVELLPDTVPYSIHVHGNIPDGDAWGRQLRSRCERNPNVILHGSYEPQEMARHLSRVDVVVVASRYESNSLVIDEARACGVPVIANRVGGMPEKLVDGGVLIDAGSSHGFAAAIEQCALPDVLQELRASIEPLADISLHAREVMAVYESAVMAVDESVSGSQLRTERNVSGSQPLTSIVILTRNELEYTQKCVESILKHTPEPIELIFVDNGSHDDTLEYLHSLQLDNAVIIDNHDNLGFGAGCNVGMSVARGDFVLLLNNDTVVTDGWLASMLQAMDHDSEIGIVGPRSNNVAGIQKRTDIAYDVWTLEGLSAYAQQHTHLPAAQGSEDAHAIGQQVPRLIGFCMLIRREVLDDIGGFDLRFGLGNFEDDDLCMRAGVAGWRCWMSNNSFVHHFGSRTFVAEKITYSDTMAENWKRFSQKWNVSLLPGGGGYDPAQVLRTTPFVQAAMHELMAGYRDTGATTDITGRAESLLVSADPHCPGDLANLFCAAAKAATGNIATTIVVHIDPYHAASTYDELGALADMNDPAGELDIVTVEHPISDIAPLARSISTVVVGGRRQRHLANIAEAFRCAQLVAGDLAHEPSGSVRHAA